MLKLENVSFSYGKNTIIKNFNFEFKKGKVYGLSGVSGKGKTTLFNLISKQLKVKCGNILFDNKNIESIDNFLLLYVGYIYQDNNLFLDLKVIENIDYMLELLNIKKSKVNMQITKISKLLNINIFMHRKVSTLSLGEQQRVAILRALVKQPKIILADEPTSNIDERQADLIFDLLTTENNDKVVIIISHDIKRLNKYCDKVICL